MKTARHIAVFFRLPVEIRSIKRRGRLHVCGDRGSALVEFALVLPVLLLFITSVVAMVFTFNQALEFENATIITGQLLSISRGNVSDTTTNNVCLLAENGFYAAAPNFNQSDLTFSFVFNAVSSNGTVTTTTISGANPQSSSNTGCDTTAYDQMNQGSSVTVLVTYPCISPFAVYGGGAYSNGTTSNALNFNCALASEVTEIIQ